MCDVVSRAVNSMPERERGEVLAALAEDAAAAASASPRIAPGFEAMAPSDRAGGRTRLVTVGVAGGPVISNPSRVGVCTAIIHADRMYVVDLGVGSLNRLAALGQRENGGDSSNTFLSLRALFFTHMHSDHCVDWPALYATGTMMANKATDPVQVFGPGRRDTLPRVFPPHRPEPSVIEPDDPTPGIEGMTRYLRKAFAADFNDRARDSNFKIPDDWFDVHDIDHSPHWTVDPAGIPPRLSGPIEVWEDGDVRVTATLVDHHPTAPAYGFRFDTPDGSIVVSGDTTVSENLIDLAHGADYFGARGHRSGLCRPARVDSPARCRSGSARTPADCAHHRRAGWSRRRRAGQRSQPGVVPHRAVDNPGGCARRRSGRLLRAPDHRRGHAGTQCLKGLTRIVSPWEAVWPISTGGAFRRTGGSGASAWPSKSCP